jgi:hypothetical protein
LPFNILVNPPSKGDLELAKSLRQLSRLKYGREKNTVEAEILERGKVAVNNLAT